ncbi:Gfo/Idh/MocA family oxidoreductase [Chitinophagaceae bacterium LB-8]|uniref:Gfo/Idh/MocA family oxidoreductase n=1 Tax=Paraflavisolibacter caeni TaxID=2982496 RepID=A0A9X2Y072_9BACT|nr:Gfo/Idh/MocA family oxidoreductase [Paraflavisolibacter caeni]MCU7552147.1 Gfo/Idh/MocA family oxidoreductase [Paraflavisolibacter caeni]
MKQIKWGIIGCGDVAEVKSGPAFNKVPNSKLVAVMRRNAEKAKDFALRHNVDKWYTDAQDLIDDEEVNAIYVATPPSSHEEYTINALKKGKPVYVEKPMALDTDGARKMLEVAKETGVKLTVAHYRREQPMFLKVKEFLHKKAIGDIRFVNLRYWQPASSYNLESEGIQWRVDPTIAGGGIFHDIAPHQIDLLLYYFGKVKEIKGFSINQAGLYKADDLVAGQMLFENGIIFNGSWCFTVAASERQDICEIIGSKGKIAFPVFGNFEINLTQNNKSRTIGYEKIPHVQQPMIAKVVEYFLNKIPNPCPPEDGVEVMRIMQAMSK